MALRVSVVMPTYNRASYLPQSVGSVLAQTVPPAEILIADDGSTDDTEAVISRLNGPIRYLRQQNRGPAAARNLGIRHATGEVVALLDSDDLWRKDKLEKQLAVLERRPGVGLVHSAAALIDGDGRVTGEVWGRPEYQGRVFERLLIANGINASSVVVRREQLEAAGLYDERFPSLENWDLWIRLSRCSEIAYLEEPLIEYRVHGGNLIKNLEKQRHAYTMLLSKHLDPGGEPLPIELKSKAYARFHQAFADAHVGRGEYARAQLEFAKSLFYRPFQPGVIYRLLRVSTARLGREVVGGSSETVRTEKKS